MKDSKDDTSTSGCLLQNFGSTSNAGGNGVMLALCGLLFCVLLFPLGRDGTRLLEHSDAGDHAPPAAEETHKALL